LQEGHLHAVWLLEGGFPDPRTAPGVPGLPGYGGGVNIEVTPLPGIGVRKDFALRDGRRHSVRPHPNRQPPK
jgi:hypothetical protein